MEDAVVVSSEELRSAHTRAREFRGEVLSGPERRRRWSTEEKLRVLAQSVAPGSSPFDVPLIVAETERIGGNPLKTEIESRAAPSLATQTAVDVMSGVVRYAGCERARAGHLIERTMRDVRMAQTHFYVSDSAIELHGHRLLGETNLDAAS